MEKNGSVLSNDLNDVETDKESDDEDIISFKRRPKKNSTIIDSDSDEDGNQQNIQSAQNDLVTTNSNENYDSNLAEISIDKEAEKQSSNSTSDSSSDGENKSHEFLSDHKSKRIKKRNSDLSNKFKIMTAKNKNEVDSSKESEIAEPNDFINSVSKFRASKVSDLYDSDSSDGENVDDSTKPTENSEKLTNVISENVSISSAENDERKIKQRLSAKQAMEQMKKIKSESCRMLREKRFSLPYHRPKQLSLKDIISKKNIQFIPRKKCMKIRMTDEELQEYAKKLQEKENEMIKLCKSDSDDESKDNDITSNSLSLSPVKNSINDVTDDTCNVKVNNDSNHIDTLITDNLLNDANLKLLDDNNTEENTEIMDAVQNSEDHNEDKNFKNLMETDNECDSINLESNIEPSQTDIKLPNPALNLTEMLSCSSTKPVLSGTPGSIIDLTPDVNELSSVDIFKKNFHFQASLKTADDIEREQEKKLPPGTALMNFKRDLENQISKQRLEEWNKKNLENLTKIQENKALDDELSDCEELIEKEMNKNKANEKSENCEDDIVEEEEDDEEEDIEDDVEIKDAKKRPKCDLIEDEAELDDDDDYEDSNDTDEDDTDIGEINADGERKLKRIYKPVEDSSSSDEETFDNHTEEITVLSHDRENFLQSFDNKKNINLGDSNDIFESQDKKINESFSLDCDDHITLEQKCRATPSSNYKTNTSFEQLEKTPIQQEGRPDLASLVSPLMKLITTPSSSSLESAPQDKLSMMEYSPKKDNKSTDNWLNPQKKLFTEPEPTEDTPNTQDLLELCSGKFPSSFSENVMPSNNKSIFYDSEMTQTTENELLELCTGKFIDSHDSGSFENPKNVEDAELLNDNKTDSTLCEIKKNDNNKSLSVNIKKDELLKNKPKVNTIKTFFAAITNKDKPIVPCNDISTNINEDKTENKKFCEISVPTCNRIISSSSEDENELTGEKTQKRLKSKKQRNKRRPKALEISDDEDDDFDQEDNNSSDILPNEEAIMSKEVEYDSEENENIIENNEVDYDSEENEVEVNTNNKSKTKATTEFFDHEAELTSEDEWKGSGDEDERGLDEFEWEEGDADQIDERKVTKELERIHRHQMLDQDNREIKLLQDILLEDGDLEGGTRERKFKWKNLDSGIESGAVVGEDNQDDNMEIQTEEEWRKQRYERELYLRQLMEKEESSQNLTISTNASLKFSTKTSLTQISIKENENLDNALQQNVDKENIEKTADNSEIFKKNLSKDLPSPVKKPFILMQKKYKGFLSRGEASLNRLALLAKSGIPDNESETSKIHTGKNRNFVFTTVSPPCNVELKEDVKRLKRKICNEESSPILIKKIKSTSNRSTFKKSLFDQID